MALPGQVAAGQQLREARITPDGLDGDRRYAIFDVDTGIGCLAVGATVSRPGAVAIGDELRRE